MDDHLHRAIILFNHGEFFRCHEVLEEAWVTASGPRRLFLQSLIHCAVGFCHHQRGNTAGATSQLRKGLDKLAACRPLAGAIGTQRWEQDILAALARIEAGSTLSAYPQIHARRQD